MPEDTHVSPQWQPPTGLSDPYMRRLPSRRADWCRANRGRLDTREQAVAFRLSDYGNPDGSRCHPGIARLAEACRMSDKTVRRSLAALVDGGWIELTARGNSRIGHSDVYQLTLPGPLAVEKGKWPEEWGEQQWRERPSWLPKHPAEKPRPDRKLPVTWETSPVPAAVSPVPRDLPPGPVHPDLSTPFSGSTTGARQVAREVWDDVKTLNPDDLEYDDHLLATIEDHVGHLDITVESAVRGMLASGEHPRLVVNKALQMSREAS